MKALRLSFFSVILVIIIMGCHTMGKSGHDGLSLSDCMPDRKNEEVLTDKPGSIISVADQFVILSADGQSRYLACNLPESYKKEGIKVTFSLVVKEILPNERHIATPAYLTKIGQ
ncbi:MAG: hypothetical protein IPL08_03835 [Saprospiraceae bacterium]|nr:hypothetical protein [Saprospiraceae bacterium]MBK8669316.1 hypothetical protein [Saprospiraceae bacterium]